MPSRLDHGSGPGFPVRQVRRTRGAELAALALPLLAITLAMLESAFVAAADGLARLVGGV
ncbi:hypothetical protein JOD31_001974 [Methylopila capsulata]|uniref:Uncharacterized protein n=1 Tax=Methylopila capsulata TaxID=61654 RepID=A0A9W6IT94_9HYPH|nr:hypothetical protein [Methylopila capsulata]MBM7851749.1 hypothetical protein [Methylopila capsulata]GLK54810.1 hypothetical protein GCM10008170_08290 [Methylopila capsulata]